jgi:hypothetical protein
MYATTSIQLSITTVSNLHESVTGADGPDEPFESEFERHKEGTDVRDGAGFTDWVVTGNISPVPGACIPGALRARGVGRVAAGKALH